VGRPVRVGDYVEAPGVTGFVIDARSLRDLLLASEEEAAAMLMGRVKQLYKERYRDYQEVLIEDERRKILRWFHTLEVKVVRRHGERSKEALFTESESQRVPREDAAGEGRGR